MKEIKNIILTIATFILFVSCSRSIEDIGDKLVKGSIGLDFNQTRAGGVWIDKAPTRYVVGVYNATTKQLISQNIYANGHNISILLPIGTYDFCFWADCGAYDIGDLSNITLDVMNSKVEERVAFSKLVKGYVVDDNFSINELLSRTVARINIINKSDVASLSNNTVTLEYTGVAQSYNLLLDLPSASSCSYKSTTTYLYSTTADTPFVYDYLFAPLSTDKIGLIFKIEDEHSTTVVCERVTNLTIKQNNVTNIYKELQ